MPRPLFGIYQGVFNLKYHFNLFYETIEVQLLKIQYVMVDGFNASVHCEAEFKFKGSGSTYSLEFVALVEPDYDGRVRTLKLFFDTANFLKAFKTPNKSFTDVREKDPHPAFNPESAQLSGPSMSDNLYNTFLRAYTGQGSFDSLFDFMAEGVEVAFKSDVEILPYAGQYSGIAGFKKWFENLFSLWSLCSFNFTRIIAEGNIADFEIHELHYYNTPDGSKRYHDSAWLVETYLVTDTYKAHYGYPADYPPGK